MRDDRDRPTKLAATEGKAVQAIYFSFRLNEILMTRSYTFQPCDCKNNEYSFRNAPQPDNFLNQNWILKIMNVSSPKPWSQI